MSRDADGIHTGRRKEDKCDESRLKAMVMRRMFEYYLFIKELLHLTFQNAYEVCQTTEALMDMTPVNHQKIANRSTTLSASGSTAHGDQSKRKLPRVGLNHQPLD